MQQEFMLSSFEIPPELSHYVRTVSCPDLAHQCSVQVDVGTVKIRCGVAIAWNTSRISASTSSINSLQCNASRKATKALSL
jgi:hypothetical protein